MAGCELGSVVWLSWSWLFSSGLFSRETARKKCIFKFGHRSKYFILFVKQALLGV